MRKKQLWELEFRRFIEPRLIMGQQRNRQIERWISLQDSSMGKQLYITRAKLGG
jgi:hypothetical protein